MFDYLIIGITLSLACVVQPGPFQAFLISESLANGWKKTLPGVFAPLITDVPIAFLVLFVLTNLPHDVLRIIQCVGGVFMFYLAFNAYKNWINFNENSKKEYPAQKSLYRGVIVNFLNPGPYLGWSLISGPLIIKGWGENPLNAIVYLISFYGSMIIFSAVLVILFAAARNLGPRFTKASLGLSAIAFIVLGFYQLWSGLGFKI